MKAKARCFHFINK